MFVLLTCLPFTWTELSDMGTPIHELNTEYSGLVPNVTVSITGNPASRRRFGKEVGIEVRAASLEEIRNWVAVVDEHHNGGACSINVEEEAELLNKFMTDAQANSGQADAVIYRQYKAKLVPVTE